MANFISNQAKLNTYVSDIEVSLSSDDKKFNNIKLILEHIKKIANTTLATIQIKQLLINQLKELIPIIVSINNFNLFEIEKINTTTYKKFDILAWKFYYCITEYTAILNRLNYDASKEPKNIVNELKLGGVDLVNLDDMKYIIPNETHASLIKETTGKYRDNVQITPITMVDFNPSKKSSSNNHIIILPGCADNMQGIDRVNLCGKLINEFYVKHNNNDNIITHIIVSGRGSSVGTGLKIEKDKKDKNGNPKETPVGFHTQIINQLNNTDGGLPPRFLIEGTLKSFDKNSQKDLVKYGEFKPIYNTCSHFKTEAYYMAIEVNRILNDLYKDKSITKPKPKILLESLAAETAANFVFAPFSCLYEYDGEHDDVIIKETSNDAIDTLTNEFLTTLLKSNLHIISHDYHILRCINTSMQTLRPTLDKEIVKNYGDISYYCVKDITESPNMLAYNAFDSFAQPYSQLFFDMHGTKTANINYQSNNTIPIQRITEKQELKHNPYNFLFEIVVRLVTFHGMYNNPASIPAGYRLTNLMYKIYPNILVGNLNDAIVVGGYLNIKKRTKKNKNDKNKKSKKNKHSNKK